jgi:hypothetical protein
MWHVRDTHPSGSSRPCVRSNRNGLLQPDTAQWQDSCGRAPLHLNTEFCCVEHSCDGAAFAKETDEERKKRQALALHELEFGGVVEARLRRQGGDHKSNVKRHVCVSQRQHPTPSSQHYHQPPSRRTSGAHVSTTPPKLW